MWNEKNWRIYSTYPIYLKLKNEQIKTMHYVGIQTYIIN